MKDLLTPIPEVCRQALAQIEADPLALTGAAEAHVRTCPACFEARVAWLAQEEASAQAPAGYFERLPERILSKLPTGPRRRPSYPVLWALAATLLAAVGAGGFLAGRANRAPMVEAELAPPPAVAYPHEALPDTPFQEGEDDYAQLPEMTPEEAHRFMERVRSRETRP
ncbi:MAG: hypothetical protein ABSH53_11865 [Holophaga sp.]|jgi:hypothetical protein